MTGFVRVSVSALMIFLSACGTLEIAVDRTPTPDVAVTGTIGALQAQNAELATKVAILSAPTGAAATIEPASTASSPATPTAAIPGAARITFAEGATVGMVSGSIEAGKSQSYVLQAFQGQPMFVYVGSKNKDVTLAIENANGNTILSLADLQSTWQGTLPRTEDYYLTIHGGASTENFSLAVTVPSRIQFAEGATSAKVDGKTVGGYGVSYTVSAGKAQTMSVSLENLSSKAALTIYGFSDGQYYVRSGSGETSFQLVLPSTQDYIIVVTPTDGSLVSYSMTVKIQ